VSDSVLQIRQRYSTSLRIAQGLCPQIVKMSVLNANALAGSLPCRLDERKQHIECAAPTLAGTSSKTLRCIASISIAPLRYLASDALAPRLSRD